MTTPREARPYGSDDRQTEQLVSWWLHEEAPVSTPPTLVPSVQVRVASTPRRHGWRVADWWLWRPQQRGAPGYVLATATAVLAFVVLGVSSVGVFMMFAPGAPAPLGPGAQGPATLTPLPGSSEPPTQTVSIPTTPADAPVPPDVDSRAAAVGVFGTLHGQPTAPVPSPLPVEGLVAFDLSDIEATATIEVPGEPSLSGEWRWTGSERRYGDAAGTGGAAAVGSLRIETADGSWGGRFVGIAPPGEARAVVQAELTGSGQYQGRSAMLRYAASGGPTDDAAIVSVTYEGDPPAAPGAGSFDEYDAYVDGPLASSAPGTPAAEEPAVFISGTMAPDILEGFPDDGGTAALADDETEVRSWRKVYDVPELALSDPRLDVDMAESITNVLRFGGLLEPGGAEIGLVRARTAEGGGWIGTLWGFEPRDGRFFEDVYRVMELEGEGAYRGLSAILFSSPDGSGDQIRWSVEGLLIPGELPEYPAGP